MDTWGITLSQKEHLKEHQADKKTETREGKGHRTRDLGSYVLGFPCTFISPPTSS